MSKLSELLTRAIAKEGTQNGYWKKLEFWTGQKNPEFTGGEEPTPDILSIMHKLTPKDLSEPEIRILAATAGNFIWGDPKTYKLPEKDARIIADKIKNGQPLTAAERLYCLTSQIDTDMF